MNKGIFLDRDGTIIRDKGFIKETKQVRFYPYTFKALSLAQKYFKLFIITNQPGISKGYLTLDETIKINEYILKILRERGIIIERIYCCPHSKEDNCSCRKPKTYFVDLASKEYSLDLKNSYVIGDHPSDIQLAQNAGMQGIYVLTGHGKRHYNDVEYNITKKINLKKAIEYIISKI